MEKKVVYELKSLYRDNLRVTGYTFGDGEKSLCIIGNLRGNEYQQIYICSQLVKKLTELEADGKILPGHQIMVIPSGNPYSMNLEKRFWPTDNTDINRMFPGYDLGETTQRIAAGIFEAVTGYRNGIQFTSFYMPGDFLPHVRIMDTGRDYREKAKSFGLPYIVKRAPRPYDTTTLNYNWQIWETDAFSLYSTTTERIDEESAGQMVASVLNFMIAEGMLDDTVKSCVCDCETDRTDPSGKMQDGSLNSQVDGSKTGVTKSSGKMRESNLPAHVDSRMVDDGALVAVRPYTAGVFKNCVRVGQTVKKDDLLAEIHDPYDGTVREKLRAPIAGDVFFVHTHPMTYANTAVVKIMP